MALRRSVVLVLAVVVPLGAGNVMRPPQGVVGSGVSHPTILRRTVQLRALNDDDDDDDDPFADLIQARDTRRENIKKKAESLRMEASVQELMGFFEDEKEQQQEEEEAKVEDTAVEEEEVEEEAELVAEAEEEDFTEGEDEEEEEFLEENEVNDDDNYIDDDEDDDAVVTTTDLFDKLFLLADADTSGGIDADEFGALFRMIRVISGESDFSSKSLAMTAAETEAKVHAIFNGMDKDGSGTVELSELKEWLFSEELQSEWPELAEELKGWDA